ncbi:MAG TPA: cytochrome b/b6 domain-containing protein [Gaiellales bacterium]|nr:cytochrome b/b6 domain-containing protein [Gaiellales bacterium]
MTAERLQRFTRTERAAHWLVVAMFAAILLSGTQMPHRWDADQPVVDVHVGGAAILVAGMALLLWRADRRSLLATGVQLATTEPGDGDWLRGVPERLRSGAPAPPVGRFNAGQKMNARLAALGFAVLYATGLALLLVGRGLPQGPLHTLTTVALVGLLSGHVFMAVFNPGTRHALRGMTLGHVDREWAEHHHPLWVEAVDRDRGPTA